MATVSNRRARGLALGITSALCFGVAGPVAKPLVTTGWSPGAVVIARAGIATLLLLAVAVWRGRLLAHWRRLGWVDVLLLGGCAIGGVQLAFFTASSRIPVGVALAIEYTSPVLVLLWEWLGRGHRPTRTAFAGVAACVLGVALVVIPRGEVALDLGGLLFAAAGAVMLAIYFLLPTPDDPCLQVPRVTAGLGVATVLIVVVGLCGLLPLDVGAGVVDGEAPWRALVLGIVPGALAYLTGLATISELGGPRASALATAEVVLAMAIAWILLGENPGPLAGIGTCLIVTGVVVVISSHRVVAGELPLEESALPEGQ